MSAENGTMDGTPRKLHPLVAGAAVAVMIFSALGIAAITGALPGALSQKGADSAQAPVEPRAAACPSCGTIESIRAVELKGEATGLGAVAGGVTGAVVGHQLGDGRGQDAMTVLGAAGGALAGHEIEKNVRKHVVYRVTVKMDDGSFRTVSQASAPAFAVGDKVRVERGALRAAKS